jgi:hypothetical protein
MKLTSPLKTILTFLLIFVLHQSSVLAQCSGNVHIDSQEQLNKFECKTWDGSLLVSDKTIEDLSPLEVLLEVTGDLLIEENENLQTLQGIHNIVEIGGSLVIRNNPNLEIFGKVVFALEAIGKDLTIIDCPQLSNQENFPSLRSVKSRFTAENVSSLSGFSNLQECPWIRLRELKQSSLEGFKEIGITRILNIESCPQLQSIDAFGRLETVVNYDGGGTTVLQLLNNPNLQAIPGLSNVSEVTNLSITGNSKLGDCCDLLTALLKASGIINISGNSSGCQSQNAINADPKLNNCPGNQTVSTSSSSCGVSYSITQPTPSDNCDLTTTSFRLTLSDGSIAVSQNISSGSTSSYSLLKGSNIFRFEANDGAGNQTVCNATITVVDDVKPSLSNCPTNVTIDTDSNIQCTAGFSYSAPNASDNCSLNTFDEEIVAPGGNVISNNSISSGQNFTKTFALGTSTVSYTATDEEGNVSECSFSVTVEDSKFPVLSGIPASVTISCDDAFPSIPSPTATDICDGNLTNAISMTNTTNGGSCGPGEIAETQEYTWTVTDNAGNSTSATWSVTVLSDFEFDLGANLSLCGENSVEIDAGNIGASYLWSTGATTRNISVTSTGTYSLTVTTENGCCYSDAVQVAIGENPTASASGGVLSCTAGSIMLNASSTTSGVSYSWTGPGGFTSTQQNPSVTSVGTYNLTVTTSNGCTDTAQAQVTADTDVPNVSATGGLLTCDISETTINANSTTSGVSYSWTGPSGFTSSQKSPTVSIPGIYTATVTAENGCTSSAEAEVIADQNGPSLNISAGMLSCNILETKISVIASSNAASFSWTGPNGFSSLDKEPTIEEIGLYTITSTAENGCTTSEDIEITGDYELPNASATGGTISCSENETMISGSSSTPNATFSWSGPNDFSSNLQSPFISQPGTYTLTVNGENGCTASAEAMVIGDGEIPNITASGGTIDCFAETVVISGTIDDTTSSTLWTGPNGFATTQLTAEVDIPGTYTFTATTPGGCQSFASVQVILDNSEPTFTLGEGFIDCDGGVRDFILLTNTEEVSYSWTGPNGFESTVKQPTYSEAGTYSVTITGDNGCVSTGSIVVDHDIPYTFEITTTNGLTEIMIEGGTPPFNLLWNDNTEGTSISNLSPGENFIRITDGLGCERIEFFEITSTVIDLNILDDVRIYPNPTLDILYIDLNEELKNSRIDIIDQKGALILSRKAEAEFNVSNLPSGIYFLRINTLADSYFYKFVKL